MIRRLDVSRLVRFVRPISTSESLVQSGTGSHGYSIFSSLSGQRTASGQRARAPSPSTITTQFSLVGSVLFRFLLKGPAWRECASWWTSGGFKMPRKGLGHAYNHWYWGIFHDPWVGDVDVVGW